MVIVSYTRKGLALLKRKHLLFLTILCICAVLQGCNQAPGKAEEAMIEEASSSAKKQQEVTGPPETVVSPIDEMIEQMTLEEKIGQLMIIGVEGKSFSPEMDNLIRNYHVGVIIIMGGNVSTSSEVLQLINDVKTANVLNKLPLFMSVDEEGGRVSRLPPGFNKLPTNGQIGKRNDEMFSYQIGTYLSELLHGFGYNMNFAPVLDVNSNPNNPVIGNRAFGPDPSQVAMLGTSTMQGMMDNGIIPVVKHFPGHGDTVVDSHKALPKVEKSLEELRHIELVPFQEAINEGADAIMVAHLLIPALDPKYPSSMSKAVITGLLREEMKFEGVVITDDLTMGAIVNEYSVAEAAVQSFIAGSDLLLIVGGYENEVSAIEALKAAIETELITEERLNESLKRILTLKEKYDVNDEVNKAVDVDQINASYLNLMTR